MKFSIQQFYIFIFAMLQTRIHYKICHLHDEPLNYLCLHSKCSNDRIICAICREERHSDYHMTTPLKIYLSQKAQQVKCLTTTKINLIQQQLIQLKDKTYSQLSNMKNYINFEFQRLGEQCDKYFNQKINTLKECEKIINQQVSVQNIQKIENILKIVIQHQQYQHQFSQKLSHVQQTLKNELKNIKFDNEQTKWQWISHPNLEITQNSIKSNDNEYKIAYLSKNIRKSQSKINFRIVCSTNNWIGVGVCHDNIVKQRGYSFRYHTIGHGVYMISSNGGMWSHHKSQFNNKLGTLTFTSKESVTVSYDFKECKVIFENQLGQRFSLQVDEAQIGSLHYCIVLYYQDDIIQVVPELFITN